MNCIHKILMAVFTLLYLTACGDQTTEPSKPLASAGTAAEAPAPAAVEAHAGTEQLGTVEFPVSCNDAAQPFMQRGLALLHHMTYTMAEADFSSAIAADADCALAYWGVAMTYIHPLWHDSPSAERLERGLELLRTAEAIANKTGREAGYIAAAIAYYDGAPGRPEAESLQHFRDGWERVYREHPEDIEAASFFALAHLATADPKDQLMVRNAEAGSIAEAVLAREPNHPAGHHYIIHAYDTPRFANRALDVARNYSEVAPNFHHALHMPTHIFTRLGLWPDSIDLNTRSTIAAKHHVGGQYSSSQALHAQDYMVYAYLQQADEQRARDVMTELAGLQAPWDKNARGAAAYALAAVPARIAMERRQWSEAAQLQPRLPASFPWSAEFSEFEAVTWFSRGIGAARSGQLDVARDAVDQLDALQQVLDQEGDAYWAEQVRGQSIAVRAWVVSAEGEPDRALSLMREASDLELSTQKHAITPGEVLPLTELLGDMLFEMNQPQAALAAYQASMDRSPNRFNSLYGAAVSAELSGDTELAGQYFGQLVKITRGSTVDWPRLTEARAWVQKHATESDTAGP
jgi:tetratricopeptide (TPR) repeat protein